MADLEPNHDLFGKLPDEILCRIVSFLPPETTLETSLVSSRWRGLWDATTSRQSSVEGVPSEVTRFAATFEKTSPLRRPRRLHLCLGHGTELLASIAANDRLKLDFSVGDSKAFSGHYFGAHLRMNSRNGLSPPCRSKFFVRTLHLKSLRSLCSDAVSSIISEFDCLESLKILECEGLTSLRVESSPNLASLAISDCPEMELLHLKCPKLRSFRYRGKLPRIRLENHFNLVDATLDFRAGLGDESMTSGDFDPALLTFKNSERVKLCRWTFEGLIRPSLKDSFRFYKLKELRWIDYSAEEFNTDCLIHFLKLCPALERLFITIDPKSYRPLSSSACTEKVVAKRDELGKLREVRMKGFVNEESEIRLEERLRELVSVSAHPRFVSASHCNSGDLVIC